MLDPCQMESQMLKLLLKCWNNFLLILSSMMHAKVVQSVQNISQSLSSSTKRSAFSTSKIVALTQEWCFRSSVDLQYPRQGKRNYLVIFQELLGCLLGLLLPEFMVVIKKFSIINTPVCNRENSTIILQLIIFFLWISP